MAAERAHSAVIRAIADRRAAYKVRTSGPYAVPEPELDTAVMLG